MSNKSVDQLARETVEKSLNSWYKGNYKIITPKDYSHSVVLDDDYEDFISDRLRGVRIGGKKEIEPISVRYRHSSGSTKSMKGKKDVYFLTNMDIRNNWENVDLDNYDVRFLDLYNGLIDIEGTEADLVSYEVLVDFNPDNTMSEAQIQKHVNRDMYSGRYYLPKNFRDYSPDDTVNTFDDLFSAL